MTHLVKKGDTLWSISKKYDVTIDELVAHNGIKDRNIIQIGQVLKIPGKESPQDNPTNNQLYNALITCLDAIEELPEFRTLSGLLEE